MQHASKLAAGTRRLPISILNAASNHPELVPTDSDGKVVLSQSSSLKPIGVELDLHHLTYTIAKISVDEQTKAVVPANVVVEKLEDELERVACRSMN